MDLEPAGAILASLRPASGAALGPLGPVAPHAPMQCAVAVSIALGHLRLIAFASASSIGRWPHESVTCLLSVLWIAFIPSLPSTELAIDLIITGRLWKTILQLAKHVVTSAPILLGRRHGARAMTRASVASLAAFRPRGPVSEHAVHRCPQGLATTMFIALFGLLQTCVASLGDHIRLRLDLAASIMLAIAACGAFSPFGPAFQIARLCTGALALGALSGLPRYAFKRITACWVLCNCALSVFKTIATCYRAIGPFLPVIPKPV
jgi:hypothetical protein